MMNNETGNVTSSSDREEREEQVGHVLDFKGVTVSDRETNFYDLFEYVPCAIYYTDAKWKIVTVNRMAAELCGFSREELLCMDWTTIFPSGRPGNNAIRSGMQNSGDIYSGEGEIHCKAGGYISVAVSYRVMADGSKLLHAKDITELKRAEKLLKASEIRYRELNTTKDKFFSIIAHDLKSPFSTIMGFSTILSDQVKKREYDGIEEYAQIIENASVRAMELLRNLLEWSRAQTGRMTFSPEPFDLSLLIRETVSLLNDAATQKDISVRQEVTEGFSCKADRPMIGSVLRNLLSNAIKFTHSNGAIVIRVESRQDETVVEVSDTGLGIAETNIHKLFRIDEAFSTTGTRNEKGTGLGLLLSKEFIDKHGGHIWAESEPGKGSRFCFSIPRKL